MTRPATSVVGLIVLSGLRCSTGSVATESTSSTARLAVSGAASETAQEASSTPPAKPVIVIDESAPLVTDFGQDIVSTRLGLDVKKLEGSASVSFRKSRSGFTSFEIGDLSIKAVTADGRPLRYRAEKSTLDIDTRRMLADKEWATVRIDYSFLSHTKLEGWNGKSRITMLWPQLCARLFPCKTDPADGLTFELEVTGVEPTMEALYPKSISRDAPSYMPAIAIGKFEKLDLGVTTAGTKVSAWYRANQEKATRKGTKHLAQVFDFFERTYGPYTFGSEVGSVSANWPAGAYGGMEHHPYWHIATEAMQDEYTHAHEAAHGWFGNGVRIQCWQDFLLSEGTSSYIAARALKKLGVDVWKMFSCDLKRDCTTKKNTVASPPVCEPMDLLTNPLWSDVPYMKGAWFYREVGTVLGEDQLDVALARFYVDHVGKAATVQSMIDWLIGRAETADAKARIGELADGWLRQKECPIDPRTLCR